MVVGEYNSFVKPILNPKLSDFCIQLTSIQQSDVDEAPEFPAALNSFLAWIACFAGSYILCSWGYYDRVQFKNDCVLHELDWNWTNRHISLKHQYAAIKGNRRPSGMKRALKSENIPLDGTHHRALDDVKNILKIFVKYYELWDFHALFKS